jgi:hypothetical protein
MSYDPLLTVLGLAALATPTTAVSFAPNADRAGINIQPAGLLPITNPVAGDLYVDALDSNKLKWFNGSSWQSAGGGGGSSSGSVGDIQLADGAGGFSSEAGFTYSGGSLTVNGVAYAWPGADGTSGYALTTDGAGTLSWTAVPQPAGSQYTVQLADGSGNFTSTSDLSFDTVTQRFSIRGVSYLFPGTDGTNGYALTTDGTGGLSWTAAGSGSPAGADTEIQFNNAGAFGASSNLTWGSNTLAVVGEVVIGGTTAVGSPIYTPSSGVWTNGVILAHTVTNGNSSCSGVSISPTIAPSAALAIGYGVYSAPEFSGTSTELGTTLIYGMLIEPRLLVSSGTGYADVTGIDVHPRVTTSVNSTTLTNACGVRIRGGANDSGFSGDLTITNFYGLRIDPFSGGGITAITNYYGIYAQAHGGNATNSLIGCYSEAKATYTGTSAFVVAGDFLAQSGDATQDVGTMTGVRSIMALNGGDVTTGYGVYVSVSGSGTVSTYYGLYVEAYAGVTLSTRWGVYVASTAYRNLLDGGVEVSSTRYYVIGDLNTDGSWRMARSGNNLIFERRESGSWVTKQTILA